MLRKILIIIIGIILPMISANADKLTLQKNAPKSYVVKKGDTLWDISGIFLNQPWLWPKLWRLNPNINNPHLIYPGDVLRLVYDKKGQPMLVKGKPELKWSPRARKQLKDQSPVSIISLSEISPYIRYATLFTQQQVNDLPYVLGSDEGHRSSLEYFKLYIKGDLVIDKAYALYQKGDKIIDPETHQLIGFYSNLVGTGKAIRTGDIANKVPATLFVENAKQEILSGSLVVPINKGQLFPAYYKMQAVDKGFHGKIIRSASGNREFAKFDVVMINKGKQDSVKLGDVMLIRRKSPSVIDTSNGPMYASDSSTWDRLAASDKSDYKMPEEPIGKLMIFKLYDQVSMGLIMSTQKPIRLLDSVTAPF